MSGDEMPGTEGAGREVLEAAADLVDAFASSDAARYFACFSPDATFVFYPEAEIIGDRATYERLWAAWEADGFAVVSCRSLDATVTMTTPDVGIFTHRVRTRLAGAEREQAERETIVFRRCGPRWLAVHEHLSPDPTSREIR